jgi:glutathione S-transferase
MLTVHHLNNSRSQRVLWLLEELEVPYEIVKYERDAKTSLAPEALRKIHPLGKSPVITDGTTTVAESGAIMEYLVEKHERLVPARGTPEFQRYRYFLHYAEGSLMPFLVMRLVTGRMRKAPFLVRPVARAIAGKVDDGFVTPNLERHVAFLADELASREWFAGDLSAADCQMLFPMQAIAARMPNAPKQITEWVARVEARPAYQRALAKGGTYAIMG